MNEAVLESLDVLALTSRLVPSEVQPYPARDFWPLVRQGLASVVTGGTGVEATVSGADRDRVAALLSRRTALALALEQLEQRGIWTVTAADEGYPAHLRSRLGDLSPAVLHGVGDLGLLGLDGVAVVGSRDVGPEGAHVAEEVARTAARLRLPLVSGAARGVDRFAMNAAFQAGGRVVGVVADSLERAASDPETRRAVGSGLVCLITPVAPSVGFSAANAMARNKIIYALARVAVVVASDLDTGGTWAGATENLRKGWTSVVSWCGPGSGPGNEPLVSKGAHLVDDMDALAKAVTELAKSDQEAAVPVPDYRHADQIALDL